MTAPPAVKRAEWARYHTLDRSSNVINEVIARKIPEMFGLWISTLRRSAASIANSMR
jgi:hypothetical protein